MKQHPCPPGLTIRSVTPDDAPALLEYLRRIGGESDNLSFGPEGLPGTPEDERRWLVAALAGGRDVNLVAVEQGEIVGDCSVQGLTRRFAHRGELGLSVLRRWWNRGLGGALMERALAEAGERLGLEIVSLEVRADNLAAIHLYESFGFCRIGLFPGFFKVGQQHCDAVLMHRYL